MKEERAIVEKMGKVYYVKTEEGKEALVPEEELCKMIERFNLKVEGIKC